MHYFLSYSTWVRKQIILFIFETASYVPEDCFRISPQFSFLLNKQLKSFKLFQDNSYSTLLVILFPLPRAFPSRDTTFQKSIAQDWAQWTPTKASLEPNVAEDFMHFTDYIPAYPTHFDDDYFLLWQLDSVNLCSHCGLWRTRILLYRTPSKQAIFLPALCS